MKEMQKWVNLGLLIAALAVFLFFNQLVAMVWDMARLPVPDWPFEPSHLVAAAFAGGTALATRRNERANTFFNEVAMELTKVTWPNRKETVASAGVVIVLVGLASVILFLIDTLWSATIRGILSL